MHLSPRFPPPKTIVYIILFIASNIISTYCQSSRQFNPASFASFRNYYDRYQQGRVKQKPVEDDTKPVLSSSDDGAYSSAHFGSSFYCEDPYLDAVHYNHLLGYYTCSAAAEQEEYSIKKCNKLFGFLYYRFVLFRHE